MTVNRLMAGYLVVVVAAGLVSSWSPTGAVLSLGLATAVVLASVPRLYPAEDAAAWFAMATSAMVFTMADVIDVPWTAPTLRPFDLLYIPAYILNALALRRLTRHTGSSGDFWDVSVLAGGLVVLLVPVLAAQVDRVGTATLAWLYPLAALVLLALSVRLARVSPSPSSWLLTAAAGWLLASGFLMTGIGRTTDAWLIQTLHAGFLACWGLAALWPAQRATATYEPCPDPPVWLFTLAVLLVPAALLTRAVIDREPSEGVLAIACAVAGWFVVARLVSVTRATARDPATGLVMRTVLWAKAREMLAAGKTPTLFLMEMHQFHTVCETVGHRESDEVLRRITERLVGTAGDALVARSSSGGFSALADLPVADGAADQLAAGLIGAVATPLPIGGRRLQIPCSLGYATADASGDFNDLLVNTEIALHAATEARASTSIAYQPRLRAAELESAVLTADLREAIDAGQLLLEYQPIVVLADGVIEGFEALARWQHPRLGRLGPDRFVPLAESSGLIGDLGAWVLRQAIAGAAALNTATARPVFVHVNVSAEQFGPYLAPDLRRALARCGVDPALVVLEVTETVLVPDRQWLAGELRDLKATGVRVALDDFGTGYSSLARLKDLPIDGIKIDKMFVTALGPGRPARMVSGILQIADSLKLDVVAEGIERTSQRDLLAKLGCRLGQGYFYSQPVGLAQAEAMILAGPIIK